LARETWSGTSRYDAPDAPLVSFSLGSARATVTRGPFPSFFPLLRCPFYAAHANHTRHELEKP